MARRQRLHAADARNDLQAQRHTPLADQAKDAQGAVVQRRLAPQQKGAGFPNAYLLFDQLGIQRRTLPVPVLHRAQVVIGLAIACRVGHLHQAVAALGPVALQDGLAQVHQFVLVAALVEHEEHAGLAQRIDRLVGDLARVTRADADQQQVFHCPALCGNQQPLSGGCRYLAKRPVRRWRSCS